MKDGFINILKPPGMTSHDVVGQVRRILKIKKVGHAGTLDPDAKGVLPIAVGRATRLLEYLANHDKSYRAELIFGKETDSGDISGNVIKSLENYSIPDKSGIETILQRFRGEVVQTPPAYSAIKIDGKRAYELAREGILVKIPKRKITIYRLELLEKYNNSLLIEIDCSKGTYIRSLCTDIGRALKIPATMKSLIRLRVGGFSIDSSITLEKLKEVGDHAIIKAEEGLSMINKYNIPAWRKNAFCNGLSTRIENYKGANRVLVFADGIFLGVAVYNETRGELLPEKVYHVQ